MHTTLCASPCLHSQSPLNKVRTVTGPKGVVGEVVVVVGPTAFLAIAPEQVSLLAPPHVLHLHVPQLRLARVEMSNSLSSPTSGLRLPSLSLATSRQPRASNVVNPLDRHISTIRFRYWCRNVGETRQVVGLSSISQQNIICLSSRSSCVREI